MEQDVERAIEDEAEATPRDPVVCAVCNHVVTFRDLAIAVDGRSHHQCINPAGVMYAIETYREAPGVVGIGARESYFSWFPGTAWQIVICGTCHAHLGWSFAGRAEGTFVGLVSEKVRS